MSQDFIGVIVLWSVINSVWLLAVSAGYRLIAPQWVTFVVSVLLAAPLVVILITASPLKLTDAAQMERKTLVQSCMRLLGELQKPSGTGD